MPTNSTPARVVLDQLTRSGIWSAWTSSWARRGGHLVLDADSIAAHLYRHCAAQATKSSCPSNLVNYKEYARLVGRLLDHLRNGLQIVPVLVYGGVHKWAGLHAHLLGGNGQQAVTTTDVASLPNLARIIFKLAVGGRNVKAYQAPYSSYPTLVKLARDLKCPVLTNEGDFILMDVRAGFVLIEDYLRAYLTTDQTEGGPLLSRFPSTASNASTSSGASTSRSTSTSPASPAGRPSRASGKSAVGRSQGRPTSASSTGSSASGAKGAGQQVRVRVHQHRLFLRQHPGLDHGLSLKMLPFLSSEFLVQHAKSVVQIRMISRELLEDTQPKGRATNRYHLAAARLESVMRFMCARTGDILPFLIHGEVARLGSSRFEDDYVDLHSHYGVVYDLRGHVRALMEARGMKPAPDAAQLNHIQKALLERECTADFWLSLVCGPLAASACNLNRSLQFEDTKTLHSARAMAERAKSLAASVLAGGGNGKRSSGVVKIIDRQGQRLVERTLSAPKRQQPDQQVAVGRVTLGQVARKAVSKQEAAALINLAFNSRDLTRVESAKLEQLLAEWAPGEAKNLQKSNTGGRSASKSPISPSRACETHNHGQLPVLLGLVKFTFEQAAEGDPYFKANYSRLGQHFEIGLVNHHAYLSYVQLSDNAQRAAKGTAAAANQEFHREALEHDLRHLIELISKRNLENAICSGYNEQDPQKQVAKSPAKSPSPGKAPKSASSQRSSASTESSTGGGSQSGELRKQIRHLIELFNGTLEAYCELNAFLNYPLPRLQLHTCYNSILLYNLILFSCQEPINTRLVKF